MASRPPYAFEQVVSEIAHFPWEKLTEEGTVRVVWSYYFFSIQFRENLLLACEHFPNDMKLRALRAEECRTDNLSPFPGIAAPGEQLDHDEFMRRIVVQLPVAQSELHELRALGASYLREVEKLDTLARALSISSYENGGLEAVFGAMLRMPAIHAPRFAAFKHFITEHIRFDSDSEHGHGTLSAQLNADDRILPLWQAFKQLLLRFSPELAGPVCRKTLVHV